jgi:hypothetical protein
VTDQSSAAPIHERPGDDDPTVQECIDRQKQLAWMQAMERVEQEVFPDARPRSEVVVEVRDDR